MENPPLWANTSTQSSGGDSGITADNHAAELFKPFSTLDEPVRETIMRDVHAVASKLKVVLLPLDRNAFHFGYSGLSQVMGQDSNTISNPGGTPGTVDESGGDNESGYPMLTENEKTVIQRLKDWDLWGPLVVCLGLAVLLSFKAPHGESSLVFATIFTSVWLGSAIVTINAQLLGSTISFFQSVCVLGYCIFPMACAAFTIDIIKITWFKRWYVLDLLLIGVSFVWAIRASSVFIGLYVPKGRRALAVFPVLFFYTFLGWLILLF